MVYIPKTYAEHIASKRRANTYGDRHPVANRQHAEKFSVGGSRFTNVTPEGVREKLGTLPTAKVDKYLGELGEPESPSEALWPKVERIVAGWVDGRLPRLAIELGLEPDEETNRKRYGG